MVNAWSISIVALVCSAGLAQPTSPRPPEGGRPAAQPRPAPVKDPLPLLKASPQVKRNEALPLEKVKIDAKDLDDAVKRAVGQLLAMQEGDNNAEWPYEGVYRVGGQIPVGYRFGGTAITALALTRIPGYEQDAPRKAAVARAVAFINKAPAHPLMQEETYTAGYDVRGWGYTYCLHLLAELKSRGLMPKELAAEADKTALYLIGAINKTAIPTNGGWNYARGPGRENPHAPSPFMTAPTLHALWAAKQAGYTVDASVIESALTFLDKSRNTTTKEVVYSGNGGSNPRDGVPGAMGRMCAAEATLVMAGRGSIDNVRNAVDKCLEHWAELDKRRQMSGTHVPPFGVAPYYFYYAHYYAAIAVELLPEPERAPRREKLNALLFSVRQADGTWNDRVFKRSANFGTSFAVMAILQPDLPRQPGWEGPKGVPAAPIPAKADRGEHPDGTSMPAHAVGLAEPI